MATIILTDNGNADIIYNYNGVDIMMIPKQNTLLQLNGTTVTVNTMGDVNEPFDLSKNTISTDEGGGPVVKTTAALLFASLQVMKNNLTFMTTGGGGGGSDVNIIEIKGVATEVGNGAAGAGSQRIGIGTGHDIATEVTAAAILADTTSLDGKDFSTEVTLAAVLAKISADPSTETTLASVLAKIIAAPSTEAKQLPSGHDVTVIGTLPLGTGAATEVTLASILSKIIAAPSTEAKQDTLITDTNAMVVDLAAIEVILNAIKDTTGIKKITDALPAGTNNIGKVTSIRQSGTLIVDGVEYAINHDIISASSSGDNTIIVAAGASTKIRIVSILYFADADVAIRLEDGAGGTALTGVMSTAGNSGIAINNDQGVFGDGSDNTLFNMELGAAIQVSGKISWIEIP